ncbi:hypothetical protein LSH36_424g00004 [Paralvinella palmiformis]|uniref:CWH43-like N-terminal domain-containing protein n=1 Tax=Paralvinella palmiformis TaxID=53620 RepID=A0AAD9JBL7_9ANNE|nr:hypothetical protein LSH36_424g00004 [Paralvinella palmiformis]
MSGFKLQSEPRKPCIIFRLNGTLMSMGILSLPLIAFLLSVIISMIKDFEQSTATHCRVWNLFPSISAAISCCTPQRYIWRLLIALHTAPRFMIACMYYNHYMAFSVSGNGVLYQMMVAVNSLLHVLENICLLTLSFVMSHENYGFMLFSLLYMFLTLVVFRWSRSGGPWTPKDLTSYRKKVSLAVFNMSVVIISVYFFFRHNWYCEPGMYSIYSFLEYLVVISNVAFHGTAVYEYGQGELVFCEVPLHKLKAV